eukprot:6264658-Prymnesium_polylepis.1
MAGRHKGNGRGVQTNDKTPARGLTARGAAFAPCFRVVRAWGGCLRCGPPRTSARNRRRGGPRPSRSQASLGRVRWLGRETSSKHACAHADIVGGAPPACQSRAAATAAPAASHGRVRTSQWAVRGALDMHISHRRGWAR